MRCAASRECCETVEDVSRCGSCLQREKPPREPASGSLVLFPFSQRVADELQRPLEITRISFLVHLQRRVRSLLPRTLDQAGPSVPQLAWTPPAPGSDTPAQSLPTQSPDKHAYRLVHNRLSRNSEILAEVAPRTRGEAESFACRVGRILILHTLLYFQRNAKNRIVNSHRI